MRKLRSLALVATLGLVTLPSTLGLSSIAQPAASEGKVLAQHTTEGRDDGGRHDPECAAHEAEPLMRKGRQHPVSERLDQRILGDGSDLLVPCCGKHPRLRFALAVDLDAGCAHGLKRRLGLEVFQGGDLGSARAADAPGLLQHTGASAPAERRDVHVHGPGEVLGASRAELAARHEDHVADIGQGRDGVAPEKVCGDGLDSVSIEALAEPGSENRATAMIRLAGEARRASRARVGPILPPAPRTMRSPSTASRSVRVPARSLRISTT